MVVGGLQALRKEPLTVYGDGKQTRSFQFVSDLVRHFYNVVVAYNFIIQFGLSIII